MNILNSISGLELITMIIALLISLLNLIILLSYFKNNPKISSPVISAPLKEISNNEDNNKLAAVITAAVYAVISREQKTKSKVGFIVRSIKRI